MGKKRCAAVVLAGGQGRRMGTAVAKQYLLIREKPVLYYSLEAFEQSGVIDDVILVVGSGQIPYCKEEIVECARLRKAARSATILSGRDLRRQRLFCLITYLSMTVRDLLWTRVFWSAPLKR